MTKSTSRRIMHQPSSIQSSKAFVLLATQVPRYSCSRQGGCLIRAQQTTSLRASTLAGRDPGKRLLSRSTIQSHVMADDEQVDFYVPVVPKRGCRTILTKFGTERVRSHVTLVPQQLPPSFKGEVRNRSLTKNVVDGFRYGKIVDQHYLLHELSIMVTSSWYSVML